MGVMLKIGALAAAAFALAACTSSSTDQPAVDPSATPTVVQSLSRDAPVSSAVCDPADAATTATGVCVARAAEARLVVTTWGSSTCPRVPSEVVAATATEVAIATIDIGGPGASCTADASPTSSVVALPDGVDPAAALSVRITGTGLDATLQLPAA